LAAAEDRLTKRIAIIYCFAAPFIAGLRIEFALLIPVHPANKLMSSERT
jgi:hypothetical protein